MRENCGGRQQGLEEEREKVVVDIISSLQTVSLHLVGQTSLLSHSPSLCLSLSLALSLSPTLRSAKISSSKEDLIMPIDKMSKYSFSPLGKKKNKLSASRSDSTYTQTHKYNDSRSSYTVCLESVNTCEA